MYRDVILEQHVRLFRGAMGAKFLFMGDNTRPHRANIVDECLQSEDITRMDRPAYSPDLNPIEHVWYMLGRRIAARQPPPTCLPELRRALCLMSGVIFPSACLGIAARHWAITLMSSRQTIVIYTTRKLGNFGPPAINELSAWTVSRICPMADCI
ncbi:transposable element Tcb1 transposase [Trichonephila clavipes]|nr:transposable element Tcb1 transposase [Trichonephila clavipes]